MTFLFTDVEGSTRLWVADEASMAASLRVHDEIMRSVADAHGGFVFSTAGDSFALAFADARIAVACAVGMQDALAKTTWPGPALRVRIGLHRGAADERGGDFFGSVVSTAARVEAAGHGGQIVCSDMVRAALDRDDLIDLGTHRLRDVAEPMWLYQVGAGEFPALRVVPPQLIRLPAPANPLVGQDDVLRSIRAALLDRRLVTLTGVGGSGKTRLALQVGDEEIPHFPDGVVFVDLAAVADPDAVSAAVLAAADIRVGPDETPAGAVLRFVSDRRVLLIVDNCEHVIDAAAELVELVLAVRTETRILATSREMLDVDGEQVVQIPSLNTDPGGPAIRLFVDRAAGVGTELDAADPAVAEVCERLDGMPLALELAAARTATMTPAELAERLDNRFALLARAGRRRRGHSRQRTLEATIDWSYALLDPDEQALFRACSVFDDSFDLVDACGAAGVDEIAGADRIAGLAAKSLVTVAHAETGARYRLLETLRAYGEQKLLDHDETAAVRRRLIDHVANRYVPPDEAILHELRWGDIDTNYPTITTALDHATDLELPPQTRVRLLIASLLRPTFFDFHHAPSSLPEDADPDSPVTHYALLIVAVRGRMMQGDLEGALDYLRALEGEPAPWPWWAIPTRVRLELRHDPAAVVAAMPDPDIADEHALGDRTRFVFHQMAFEALAGFDRDRALTHLDRLDTNPLATHPANRRRLRAFRSIMDWAWTGPGNPNAGEIERRFFSWSDGLFTPYRDPGQATTEALDDRFRTLSRDPANFRYAAASLVQLAMAAEARSELDLMRRALLATPWWPSGAITAIVASSMASRHGFIDDFVRDKTNDEVHGLGPMFLDLAPRLDPSITGRR